MINNVMKFKILLIVLSVDDNRQMSVYLFLFFYGSYKSFTFRSVDQKQNKPIPFLITFCKCLIKIRLNHKTENCQVTKAIEVLQ